MPTFSYREKNATISVRCGARCRAYHASSMGEGKGPPHNCAPARFLFFGFSIPWRVPFHMKKAFLSALIRSGGASVGVALPAKPFTSVRRHHAYRPGRASGGWGVVLHFPQSLIPSSGSTTPPGPIEPPAAGAWCFTIRKALFLRSEAPRLSAGPSLRRPGRGASPSAKPVMK